MRYINLHLLTYLLTYFHACRSRPVATALPLSLSLSHFDCRAGSGDMFGYFCLLCNSQTPTFDLSYCSLGLFKTSIHDSHS